MGTLFLVATPIGNLEDISARALRVLKEVDIIAVEDSRRTGKLLSHYGINTKVISYHDHSPASRLEEILGYLADGNVALVSDAGTPGLNDPGYKLVNAAVKAGYAVSPIPGPSAPIAALVASGLPADKFLYLGYLPRKPKARREALEEVAYLPYTLIFLETPQRLLGSLKLFRQVLGERKIAIARELTKMYEEIFRGTVSQAVEHFTIKPPRGEFTLVVEGKPASSGTKWGIDRLRQEIHALLQEGKPAKSVAAMLAKHSGWPRREIYLIIARQEQESKRRGKSNDHST